MSIEEAVAPTMSAEERKAEKKARKKALKKKRQEEAGEATVGKVAEGSSDKADKKAKKKAKKRKAEAVEATEQDSGEGEPKVRAEGSDGVRRCAVVLVCVADEMHSVQGRKQCSRREFWLVLVVRSSIMLSLDTTVVSYVLYFCSMPHLSAPALRRRQIQKR